MIRVLSCSRKSMMRRAGLLSLALVLSLVLVAGVSAAGGNQSLPFHGGATGTWDNIFDALVAPPAIFVGTGPVTHMGNTTHTITLTLEAPIAPGLYPGYGTNTLVAANGDTVDIAYVGILDATTGGAGGRFTVTGGTGRFSGASGGGIFAALVDLSFPSGQPMTYTFDGGISY